MAFYNNTSTQTYIASAAIPQFRFMSYGANGKVALVGTAGARADAVSVTSAAADGDVLTGAYDGRVQILAANTINAGAAVSSNAVGRAIPAVTGQVILGYAVEAGVNNQIITIELNRAGTVV